MAQMHKVTLSDLMRDAALVIASIIIAILLQTTGSFEAILFRFRDLLPIASIISGIFYTSVFTTAPAIVAFTEIAQNYHVALVAIFGGLGAVLGDLIIFRFVRDSFACDLRFVLRRFFDADRGQKLHQIPGARWFLTIFGCLIIASPFPDELGLAMLGFTDMRTSNFIALSFLLNSSGILLIGLVARGL